jgi:putative transposase
MARCVEWTFDMARQPRIRTPGLVHHVISRGNGRMCIFTDDEDYLRFLCILAKVTEDYDVECWKLCLMPNHFHAVLRPTLPNLPEAMQTLNGSYALWWNKRHDHVGHVWQGRYKDPVVDTDEYLRVLCRYIALNPVRAGLAESPDQWRWSSYAATVGRAPRPTFLTIDAILGQLGNGSPAALRQRYADYVEAGPNQQMEFDRIRSSPRILGGKEFRRRIEQPVATESVRSPESNDRPSHIETPDRGQT